MSREQFLSSVLQGQHPRVVDVDVEGRSQVNRGEGPILLNSKIQDDNLPLVVLIQGASLPRLVKNLIGFS